MNFRLLGDGMEDVHLLRAELQGQLEEQRASLAEIDDALAAGESSELQQLREDLVEAIGQLEAALQSLAGHSTEQPEGAEANPALRDGSGTAGTSNSAFEAGCSCRFRYTDGRWYHGTVVGQEQGDYLVCFAYPTRQFMLQAVRVPCGIVRPAHAGQQQQQQQGPGPPSFPVGARVLAKATSQQLWQAAEVVALQPGSSSATVVLVAGGRQLDLPLTHITKSAVAEGAEEELDGAAAAAAASAAARGGSTGKESGSESAASSGSSRSGSSSGDSSGDSGSEPGSDMSLSEEEGDEADAADGTAGLGSVLVHAQEAAAAGAQTEVAHFADFELHGRGIASKLMARMGHKKGQGLGRAGTGRVEPLQVALRPSRRGLGEGSSSHHHKHHHHKHHKHKHGMQEEGVEKKKRSRGGERSRRRKAAAAHRAAKEERRDQQQLLELATGSEGLFAFINQQIGDQSEAAGKLLSAGLGKASGAQQARAQELWGGHVAGSGQQQRRQQAGASGLAGQAVGGASSGRGSSSAAAGEDRRGLLSKQDRISGIQERIQKLSGMLARNKRDKVLGPQLAAKLAQAEAELKAAHADAARHSKALSQKEALKKLTKF